jgi:glycosyltransferase involved in cell wall biosynthesis
MSRSLRILLLNWQDRENPQAGGAEIHLHEIFGRLAARGHRVTLLCSGWKGAPPRTSLDGIEIHRLGGRHTFAWRAVPYYLHTLAARPCDVVIEDLNKIPLASPLWARAPVVGIVHHLFGATAFREAPPPTAAAVWAAERLVPYVYRHVPIEAVSESTAQDLVRRGIPRERIVVIHNGVDLDRFRPDPGVPRFESPTFAYVGRLKRYKGLETVLEAVARLVGKGESVYLFIAGKGDHEGALKEKTRRMGLSSVVEFCGFVSEDEKLRLLRRVWATVNPSPKEGWGIANIEAAACGTPVVASDSPGLRDSVLDGVSGLLIPHGDADALAHALDRITWEPGLRERLGRGALEFAQRFSWDRSADETEAHLRSVLDRLAVSAKEKVPWA